MPIETYCHAAAQFAQSKQYNSKNLVPYHLLNFHRIIINISVFGLILSGFLFKIKYQIAPNKQLFIFGLLFSILINAWLAATLVYPHNRAGCKLIWFLPLILICLILNNTKKNPPQYIVKLRKY
jgi:predicted acyltransferase